MATSAVLRRSEPLPDAAGIVWPRTVAILDADGAPLTDIDVVGPPRAGQIVLGEAVEPSALLNYVFGKGSRQVMLDLDDGPHAGWLGTSWADSRRNWWIELGD